MANTNFQLFISLPLQKLVRKFHPLLKQRTRAGFRMILKNPHVGKSLQNELFGLYSYRIGKYRIIYRLQKKMIEIIAVGSREGIYEEALKLIHRQPQQA